MPKHHDSDRERVEDDVPGHMIPLLHTSPLPAAAVIVAAPGVMASKCATRSTANSPSTAPGVVRYWVLPTWVSAVELSTDLPCRT